jgi:hypothetical protein
MLKEDVYIKSAENFGTSVGVASIIGKRVVTEVDDITFKKYNESETINTIIKDAIYTNRYQSLQRNIYKLNLKRDKRIKESTIYKKAWDITNGNYKDKPKRTKVHESNTKLGSISFS